MKRWVALLLLFSLFLCAGCGSEDAEEPVTFYYLRSEIGYGSPDSVIVPEVRTAYGDNPTLTQLLTLYLNGPVSENLKLPMSYNVRLTEVKRSSKNLTVTFTKELSYLDGMDLTLALACISSTCFSLSDVETVTIHAPAGSSGRPVLFTAYRDSFLLYDDTTTPPDADDAS